MLEFNNRLLATGTYTANDPALYQKVDEYVRSKYPSENDQMANGQSATSGQPPVTGVDGAGEKTPGKKSRTERLSVSELQMAKKLGVPPAQYAKHKRMLQQG